MPPASNRFPTERLAFAALALLVLAPVVAQGVSCPIGQALHLKANAVGMTWSSIVVAGVAWIAYAGIKGTSDTRKWISPTLASVVALILGALLGTGQGLLSMVPTTVSLLVVAYLSSRLVHWLVPRLPEKWDGLARQRKGVATLLILSSVFLVGQSSRLSTFMGDAERPELSLIPSVPFLVHHSCLTAYVQGERLASQRVENVYHANYWPELSKSAQSKSDQLHYAPFDLDAYAYPPPFLLLPKVLLSPLTEYRTQRVVWFAFNVLVLAIGLWTVASWIGGPTKSRALILAPVLAASLPTLITLQVGNVHTTVLILAMLAMVAFERDHPAIGGSLLAFAILSKISPGLLLIFLFARRRYRDVFWTCAFGIVLIGLSVAVFGLAPFKAFVVYELPRLSSGEALGFLAQPENLPINQAPFGLPFKFAFFGMQLENPWKIAQRINLMYTAVVLGLTILAARKCEAASTRATYPRQAHAILWLAILTLGALRSPFAPGYVVVTLLWALSLYAIEVRSIGRVIGIVVVWIVLAGTPLMALPRMVMYSLMQQTILLGILIGFVVRKFPTLGAPLDSRM